MFAVYEGTEGRTKRIPASEEGIPRLKGYGWTTHRFETLEEAELHANKWLGSFAKHEPYELGVEFPYNGYGDYIVIEEEVR